jgi:hypothetical protein
MFSNFVFENRAVYEIMWKNVVKPDRPQTTIIRRIGIALWISKATNTHSQYVIIIAFLLQQWLQDKGKAVPLQDWSGPEGSRKLRFPDYMTTAQDGDKVVSLTHRPPLPPGNAPGTHFY